MGVYDGWIRTQGKDHKGRRPATEFKELIESNEDLAKSIVCFANTDGGQIIIGVSKTGEIVGVENVDEIVRRIDDVAFNRCEPRLPWFWKPFLLKEKL